MSTDGIRWLRPGAWLRWAGIGVATFLVVYAIAGNVLLRTEWGRGLLNRKPEKLTLSWDHASTWIPGLVHVEGLEMQGKSRRVAWRATLDDGRAWICLPSLAMRHFRLLSLNGTGVEVGMDLLPKPDTPRPKKKKRGWKITLGGLGLEDVRKLRVGQYVLAGPASVAGKASFQIRGPMRLGLKRLYYEDAKILSEGREVARDVDIEAEVNTRPLVVTDPLPKMLQLTSGRVALSAEVENLGFLEAYLRTVPWLTLGGSGRLELDIATEAGLAQPGSHMSLTGPGVWAEFFDFRAEGQGSLEGSVSEGPNAVSFGAALDEFSLTRLSDGATLVAGEGLRADLISDSRDVHAAPEHLIGDIVMPATTTEDLAALSAYLPAATGISLTGGSAELGVDLHFDTAAGGGQGTLTLAGEAIGGRFGDADFTADLNVEGQIPRLSLLDGFFDISGTELQIDRARIIREGKVRADDWWARVQFSEGSMQLASGVREQGPHGPERVEVALAAEMLDNSPVVVFMDQKLPKLQWLDRLVTVNEVELKGSMIVDGDQLSLRGIEIGAGRKDQVEILAELDLVGDEQDGAVFARYRKLSAALALSQGERDWKLNNSREFYQAAAAEFLASPPAAQ